MDLRKSVTSMNLDPKETASIQHSIASKMSKVSRQSTLKEVKSLKVKELDWFDVESRIRAICTQMVTPVSDTAG